jgi:hypothetical protein
MRIGVSPRLPLYQRLLVEIQFGLENSVTKTITDCGYQALLCERSTLDPLAYWMNSGWTANDFYIETQTTLTEHYRRYALVLHLVTAADGACAHYRRWPYAPRTEQAEEAIKIDQFLYQIWKDHPNYHQINNFGRNWALKATEAKRLIEKYV